MCILEAACVLCGLALSGVPLCLRESVHGFDMGRNWTSPSDRSVL